MSPWQGKAVTEGSQSGICFEGDVWAESQKMRQNWAFSENGAEEKDWLDNHPFQVYWCQCKHQTLFLHDNATLPCHSWQEGLLWRLSSHESAWQFRRPGSIPGSGRSSGEGNGNPLQYCCLENPMDRRACGLESTGSQRSQTWLND